MATNNLDSAVEEAMSELAHQEAGTTQGSMSATKAMNDKAHDLYSAWVQRIQFKMENSQDNVQIELSRDEALSLIKILQFRVMQIRAMQAAAASASASGVAGYTMSETMETQEGNAHQGSATSQTQSNVTKQGNAEAAEAEIGSKLATAPETVTKEDARYVKSREARAQGTAQPPKGSIGAQAESVASANEAGTHSGAAARATGEGDPKTQSQLHRKTNFSEAADMIGAKMANDPGHVTQEDAHLLHSREVRAFGGAEKGGIAAQAQKLASKNEPK